MQLPCETSDPFDLTFLLQDISLAHASLPVLDVYLMGQLVSIGAVSRPQCQFF